MPCQKRRRCVLVGDVDQLLSVGPRQVLAEIVASGAVSVVRLTEIFRRAPESRIVTNAHRSARVRCPILARSTAATSIFRCGRCSGGVRRLLAIVRERIPKHFGLDPSRDVKMLCAEPRRPAARSLNTELQNALKPTWPDPHRAVRASASSQRAGYCGQGRSDAVAVVEAEREWLSCE